VYSTLQNIKNAVQQILTRRVSPEEKARRDQRSLLKELKKLLLEYYSAFALTICQGVVFFTQRTMDEILLIKPAYNEAQARYNAVLAELNDLKRFLNKEMRSRIDRIIKDGSAILITSTESTKQKVENAPKQNQYDFLIDIMAVQKQCLDLVSDIEDLYL